MRKKVLSAIALAAAAALAGCTGAAPAPSAAQSSVDTSNLTGEITFQTWSLKNERFTPYFEKVIADFESAHAGTKINWIDQPADGYEDKILQQANSGSLPDVVNLPDNFAIQLYAANKVVNLKAAAPESIATYVDGGIQAYTQGDAVTGYPWYLGTDLLWWNTAQLKEAGVEIPTTQDAYFTAAETAAKNTNGKVQLISGLPGIDDLARTGATIFDGQKFTFNTPEAATMIERFATLYKEGAMPAEALNADYAGNSNMFVQKKVAMTTSTASYAATLKTDAPSLVSDVEPSARFDTPPLFVQGISVASESKNPGLALAFAQYVTNNDNQVAFVKIATGFLPGTKEGNENSAALAEGIDDPLMAAAVKIAASQMPQAKSLKPQQWSDDMDKYLKQQLALVMQGKLGAQEALDKAVKYADGKL